MRIFVLTATYEIRVSRKSDLRDHPSRTLFPSPNGGKGHDEHQVKNLYYLDGCGVCGPAHYYIGHSQGCSIHYTQTGIQA